MCGVPTRIADGKTPLWRDTKSIKKIANEAVKNVYQHASSPADEKYLGQRKAIALRFRRKYNSDVHNRTCVKHQTGDAFFGKDLGSHSSGMP